MAADVKTEFKIPDLWFDFYVRFIPGTVFIACLRFFNQDQEIIPDTNEFLILLGAAYFIGLITSPLSSRLAKFIEHRAEIIYSKRNKIKQRNWVRKLQYDLGRESRDSLLLSKMHGEITMFVELALLTILFWVQNHFKIIPNITNSNFHFHIIHLLVIVVLFMGLAYEVGDRRIRKAKDIQDFWPNKEVN